MEQVEVACRHPLSSPADILHLASSYDSVRLQMSAVGMVYLQGMQFLFLATAGIN